MQELNQNILPTVGEREPTDEVKKLMCLEFATRNTDLLDPISFAKEMYEWVKGGAQPLPNAPKGDIKYDLKGCGKTVAADLCNNND